MPHLVDDLFIYAELDDRSMFVAYEDATTKSMLDPIYDIAINHNWDVIDHYWDMDLGRNVAIFGGTA